MSEGDEKMSKLTEKVDSERKDMLSRIQKMELREQKLQSDLEKKDQQLSDQKQTFKQEAEMKEQKFVNLKQQLKDQGAYYKNLLAESGATIENHLKQISDLKVFVTQQKKTIEFERNERKAAK